MSRRAAISRADLLEALFVAGPAGSVPVGLLGFERRPEALAAPSISTSPTRQSKPDPVPQPAPTAMPPSYPIPQPGQRLLRFLVPVKAESLSAEPLPLRPEFAPLRDEELAVPGYRPAPLVPLVPWRRLAPFLRQRLGRLLPGRQLDLPRLSRLLASGQPWRVLPRLSRQTWGHLACVLWDTSPEMAPYQPDVLAALRRLKRERGRHGLLVRQCYGPVLVPSGLPPQASVLVLSALGQFQGDGDLQQAWLALGLRLSRAGHPLTVLTPCPLRRWQSVLAACWPSAVWDRRPPLPRRLREPRLLPTSGLGTPTSGQSGPATELLLDLLAPATFITPALLRQVRLLLGPQADAGTEHEAWFHPHTTGSDSVRHFSFRPGPDYEARLERLRNLAADPVTAGLVRQAAALTQHEHERFCCPVIAGETALRAYLSGPADGATLPADLLLLLERAVERLRELADTPGSRAGVISGLPAWFQRCVEQRLSPELRADPAVARVLAEGFALARKALQEVGAPWPARLDVPAALAALRRHGLRGAQRPSVAHHFGLSPTGLHLHSESPRSGELPARPWTIPARSPVLHVTELAPADDPSGKPSETVSFDLDAGSRFHRLATPVPLTLESDLQRLHFAAITRPAWARRMGYDARGLWADAGTAAVPMKMRWLPPGQSSAEGQRSEVAVTRGYFAPEQQPVWAEKIGLDDHGWWARFTVAGVAFVLRWIPPGRFLMGSPKDEAGRYDDEGPQHEVTLTRGYWLGETPVTQAQWRAVVLVAGKTRTLATRLLRIDTLDPDPSRFKGDERPVENVSWNDSVHFCEAATLLFAKQAPPGFRFQLPTEAQWEHACRAGTTSAFHDGSPCSVPGGKDPALVELGWFDKTSGGETHGVKLKAANGWGLHDMHGNVWEWCQDEMRTYTAKPQVDPVGSLKEDPGRVERGGSWLHSARLCRAACRDASPPGNRRYYQGLRLAAGQEPVMAERPSSERRSLG